MLDVSLYLTVSVYAVVSVIAAVAALLLPIETKGRQMQVHMYYIQYTTLLRK